MDSDNLKIRYKANKNRGFIEYSPANLSVELNGQKLNTCQRIELIIDRDEHPLATITFLLDDIDIDSDTLTALQAIVKSKG